MNAPSAASVAGWIDEMQVVRHETEDKAVRLEGNANPHLKFIRGEAWSKKVPEAGITR